MEQKTSQAEIMIGKRVIKVPLHDELAEQFIKSVNTLEIDHSEITRFLKGYLSHHTRSVYADIIGPDFVLEHLNHYGG